MDRPLDLEHLRKFTGGDGALERDILNSFLTTARDFLATMGDSREAWRLATHSLKGSALGIGAAEIGGLARAAEGIDPADAAARAEAVAELRMALRRLEDFVSTSL